MGNHPRFGNKTFSSAIQEAQRYQKWVHEQVSGYIGHSVMEVGFGHDSLLHLLDDAHEYCGIDIDAHTVDVARKAFPEKEFVQADLASENFAAATGGRRFETVVCFNVLEHVADDGAAVENLVGSVQSGGHLIILVPAFQSLYSDLDRLAGHHRRYSRPRIRSLFDSLPVQTVRIDYFNPVGGLGWWANKFFPHNDLDSDGVNNQIRLFDKYLLPLSKLLNPLTKSFFGQSVIAVARVTG